MGSRGLVLAQSSIAGTVALIGLSMARWRKDNGQHEAGGAPTLTASRRADASAVWARVITGRLRTRSLPRNSPTVYRVLLEVVPRAHQHHTVRGVPSLGDRRSVRRMGHGSPRGAEVPGRPARCIGTQPPPPPVSGIWGNSPSRADSRAGGGSVIEEITEDWLASAMHAPGRDRPSPTAQDAGNRVRRPYAADRVPPPARSAAGSRSRHRRTSGDSRRLAAAWNQAVGGARLLARRPGAAPLRRTRPP